jgi:molecular chaperone HtpG
LSGLFPLRLIQFGIPCRFRHLRPLCHARFKPERRTDLVGPGRREPPRRGLIGQFGVGFYSSFMVADQVTPLTRRAGQSGGTRWTSNGDGTYTIEPVDEAPQGTEITLRLKPVDSEDELHDYTSASKIREIVKRYSDFIAWPIKTAAETTAGAEGHDGAAPREPSSPREAN